MNSANEPIVYINGKYVQKREAKVSVFDQGILMGDGIFEGIRTYNGRLFKCLEHLDRLFFAAKAIMIEIPMSKKEMENVIKNTCQKNGIRDGYIRLVITRGPGDLSLLPPDGSKPTVFCIAGEISLYPEDMYENGMDIITSVQRRNKATIVDPQIKSLNYLNNILAKIEAKQAGAPEALMLTDDGIVAECTGDNIFFVKDGILITPPVHVGILDGITRRLVIRLAEEAGIEVQEKEFTLFNIYSADECFLTGTAAEVIPVKSVDQRLIRNGRPGPVTKKLACAFHDYTQNNGVPIYED